MPFILIFAGILLIITAYRGTHDQLLGLIKADFSGPNNFFYWLISIFTVGAIGYIPKMKPISDAFLILIILVMFIRNRGFFDEFNAQIYGR